MTDELRKDAHIHIMGIGGFGMNPIARVMHELGYSISGCDMAESPLIAPLRQMGVPVEIGHSPAHLDRYRPELLAISSAVPADNREVWAAAGRGIPVAKRADILGLLMASFTGIAVAGTHGKTTTSGMLAYTFLECGADPTFIIGGVLQNLGANARAGRGPHFIIEADEYDRMFLGLRPRTSIITTLEMDHPDMFGSLADVRTLFTEFAGLLPDDGLLIAGYDDPETRKIAAARREMLGAPTLTYGLTGGDWTATDVTPNPAGGMDFTARRQGEEAAQVSLLLPGLHNVQNALAALIAAEAAGLPLDKAAAALGRFSGMGRRFEVKGEAQGVTVIDDYAHHPTAIRATLAAARLRYVGRTIRAVWQPHTYSRTRALLDDFAASFVDADHVIITDVYRSRDTETYGVTLQDVVDRMSYHRDAQHIAALDDVVKELALAVQPGDVVIVMSAGDASRIATDLLGLLSSENG
jgi:UDP-N-acetylmuramate--alanine ligase